MSHLSRLLNLPYFLIPKLSPNLQQLRKQCQINSKLYSVNDRKSTHITSSIEPWAFIRIKNERPTLRLFLSQMSLAFKKGIIAYNDCTDGSENIILRFCQNNPSFIPYKYPFTVYGAHHPAYQLRNKIPYENTLAAYYNAALYLIPENEWFMKIDADQIFNPLALKYAFSLVKNKHDIVSFSRLNIFRDNNNKLQVLSFTCPNDQLLLCNNKVAFFNKKGIKPNGEPYAYETMILPARPKIKYIECSNLHFLLEKTSRTQTITPTSFISLKTFLKTASPLHFDPAFFNRKNIREFINFFEKPET